MTPRERAELEALLMVEQAARTVVSERIEYIWST
jgi:hypothetical protein